MSKFGFNNVVSQMRSLENRFLRDALKLARTEFKSNFDSESNAETNEPWEMVKRKYPPKILYDTGKLMREAISKGTLKFGSGSVVLTIDPIDTKGNGYASFHQNGDNRVQREFVTQSETLTQQQINLLLNLADKTFR